MDIRTLMDELIGLYPREFAKQETATAWARQFRTVLGGYEGPKLQRAWDEVQRQWTKTGFPRPADVLAALREGGERPKQAAATGVDYVAMAKHLAERVPELVRMAMLPYRGHAAEFDFEFLAKRLADRYAQAEWLRNRELVSEHRFWTERYKLNAEDEAAAVGRFESRQSWRGKRLRGSLGEAVGKAAAEIVGG